jgi:hypothetical protein
VILWGTSGALKGLARPLLDRVTLVGMAPLVGRGSILPAPLRFPTAVTLVPPLLQVCLRDDEERGAIVSPPRGMGGREMEYDL